MVDSNALICSVDVEASQLHCSPTADLLLTATPQTTAKKSSKKGSRRVAWKMLQSSTMFDPYLLSPWPPAGSILRRSRSSLQVSRAKTSVLQAARWVFLATQDRVCGGRLCDLQESVKLSGSFSKMSLQSSNCKKRVSRRSSWTYKKQGILSDGQLYLAPTLVPVIYVRGGGLSATNRMATPRTCDYNRPMTFTTLCQNVCMSSYGDVMSRHDREVQLGHLNCQLSESIMGFPLDWTKTIDSDAQ